MVVQLTLVGLLLLASVAAATVGQAKEGCLDRCGDVSIPYPFGTNEEHCYLSPYFLVTCNHSSNPPKLLLGKPSPEGNNIQVLNISVLEGELLILNYISHQCRHNDSGEVGHLISSGSELWSGQFNISSTRNKFTMVGCDTYAWVEGQRGEQISRTGCMSLCNSLIEDQNGSCSGNGCCQTSIPDGLSAINLTMGSFYNYSNISEFNPAAMPLLWKNLTSISPPTIPITHARGTAPAIRGKRVGAIFATAERVTREPIPGAWLPRKDSQGCILNHLQVIHAAMGIGIPLVVLVAGSTWLYWALKKMRFVKLKKKYFLQNGGSELRQQLSRQGSTERIKIFTSEELEKATKNYDESNIIGRGGFGTVYKGTLTDGRIVAIKKSKMVERSQGKDFINEVVYEFINNGTLSDHIHDENKASSIMWETRLRIAIQTAEALYYLHSAASTPIIHRDVKSSNILLDDDYNAKVGDFGASRLVPLDQTQLSTAVQGTPGYLDPESMQTYRVTEKSDVYSFGVVLIELLTGKKALFFDRPQEQRILTMFFLLALKDNSLFQVLEDCIVNYGNHMQILKVAQLAKRCLSIKGDDRPTMKEVVLELEMIRMIGENNAEQNPEENTYLLGESYAHYYLGGGESSIATHSMAGSFLLPVSNAR
ncbi:Wall-associated receptor kinase 3 [Vitis vinifera]|uniref:Wall-associated receptor kinase 3 n=1 Tax=Vitis vinifera TaxID=29760 RepID=A0A438DQX3_VITVI|nr:Wall-associated receptor kinase 3 [Vitis vinifera]